VLQAAGFGNGNPFFADFCCDQEQRGPLEQEISLDETDGAMMRL
jgi:hypothetical protein